MSHQLRLRTDFPSGALSAISCDAGINFELDAIFFILILHCLCVRGKLVCPMLVFLCYRTNMASVRHSEELLICYSDAFGEVPAMIRDICNVETV